MALHSLNNAEFGHGIITRPGTDHADMSVSRQALQSIKEIVDIFVSWIDCDRTYYLLAKASESRFPKKTVAQGQNGPENTGEKALDDHLRAWTDIKTL